MVKAEKNKGMVVTKRPIRKKPKDKPKRPLSAYNYFFKQERQRILAFLARKPEDNVTERVVSPEEEVRLWTCTKKVSFEEMGKIIGRRWKNMPTEKLDKYIQLAAGDAERYKVELKIWNDKKDMEKKKAVQEMYSPPFNPMRMAYHYDPTMAMYPRMPYDYAQAMATAYPGAVPQAQPYGPPHPNSTVPGAVKTDKPEGAPVGAAPSSTDPNATSNAAAAAAAAAAYTTMYNANMGAVPLPTKSTQHYSAPPGTEQPSPQQAQQQSQLSQGQAPAPVPQQGQQLQQPGQAPPSQAQQQPPPQPNPMFAQGQYYNPAAYAAYAPNPGGQQPRWN